MRMRSDSHMRMRRQGMDHRTGMGMGRRPGTMGRRPGTMGRRRGIGGHRLQTAIMDHRLASTAPLLGIGVLPRVVVEERWSADGTMVAIEVIRIIAHESLGSRGDTSFRSHDARPRAHLGTASGEGVPQQDMRVRAQLWGTSPSSRLPLFFDKIKC
jgi:hypothetical protein